MPEYSVGINNLPSAAAGMLAGRMYAVSHHDTDFGLRLMCEVLLAASADRRATWLAEASPARAFNLLSPSGIPAVAAQQMRQAAAQNRIRIFETGGVEHHTLRREMLAELDSVKVGKGSLVVIEGADRLFDSDALEAGNDSLGTWQHWAEQTKCTLLWMCPQRVGRIAPELDITRAAHRFSGYARLRKPDDGAHWDILHWFGPEGLIADKSFRLFAHWDKPWRAEPIEIHAEVTPEAADESDVFITRAILAENQAAPAEWRIFETTEQMSAALSSATAATAIFHYDTDTPLEVIARTVFSSRFAGGSRIKIAVREVGVHLRYSQEQLLLKLGANLVIPAEINFSRMLNLLETLQGQVYSRPLQQDYEATIASAMPAAEMGYLAPKHFVTASIEALTRARALSVHNALIRFPLTVGLGALETLRCCTMKRPGDLCTADDKSVYVFLFACEEHDIEATLDRLFRLPVSVLFAGELRYLSTDDITQSLTELGLRAEETTLPDFTATMAAAAKEDSVSGDAFAETFQVNRVLPRAATPAAVRRPLRLRGS
ncbi:MAG: cellulose biosynthesis protein BcsE [Pseudomonadota bacterium]